MYLDISEKLYTLSLTTENSYDDYKNKTAF